MKLSIIIPVYNAEKYLFKCLDSVFDQDLRASDYEVIVINDGSTDDSETIILHFQAQHKNLRYLKQTNKGVSAARNAGLDVASGECITFVDSDDEIYPNSLQRILKLILQNNLDIFYPRIDGYDELRNLLPPANTMQEDRILNGLSHERRTLPPTFYSKKVIGLTKFNENISLGEDTVFNVMVQSCAERVMYSDIDYYLYFVRENSLTSQATSKNAYDGFCTAIYHLYLFQEENFKDANKNADKYFEKVYLRFISRIIEHSILPTLNFKRLISLHILLRKIKKTYLLKPLEYNYKFISHNLLVFIIYQFIIKIKVKAVKIIK